MAKAAASLLALCVCVACMSNVLGQVSSSEHLASEHGQDIHIHAFPTAGEGMVRYVQSLPQAEDEHALKVEIEVGKTVEVDGVNKHFFTGKLEAVSSTTGWGIHYHILRELGPMIGTLMAVAGGSESKVTKFVRLGGDPELLRYNSRMPLVVYVPEGVEVRYSIWRRDAESQPVPQA